MNELDLVRAGRRIAERVGARALTMRMLAAELDLSTMAAYRHVVNKTELLALIADDILSGIVIPSPEDGPWDVQLTVLETSAFAEISRVPDLWDLVPPGRTLPSELRLNAIVGDILLGAGFEPLSAAWAQEAIFSYVLGLMRLCLRAASNQGAGAGPTNLNDLGAQFAYGLRIMLAGLRTELEATATASGVARRER